MIIRYQTTRMVVTDTKLFNVGGDVRRWAERVETRFTANAIFEAPYGGDSGRFNKSRANAAYPVGSLKGSISGYVSRVGPRHLQTIISVDVPYAIYVLKGTGRIYSKSAREPGSQRFSPIGPGQGGLYIPANPAGGWPTSHLRQSVKGQTANPFLDRAFAKTARTHSSLRGFTGIGI